jgi:hypothetical protein
MYYSIDEIRDAVYATLSKVEEGDYEKLEKIFFDFKLNLEGESK